MRVYPGLIHNALVRLHVLQLLLIRVVLIGTDRLDAEEEGDVAAKLCEAEGENVLSSFLEHHTIAKFAKIVIMFRFIMERVHFFKDVDSDLRCLVEFLLDLESGFQ